MDTSYFGPVGFFVILPALFYNAVIISVSKIIRTNINLLKNYKDSLKISIIPASFFIIYVSVFKWQYFAGRYMIPFIALLMINLAVLISFLKDLINKKIFFNILLIIFIVFSMLFYPYTYFSMQMQRFSLLAKLVFRVMKQFFIIVMMIGVIVQTILKYFL